MESTLRRSRSLPGVIALLLASAATHAAAQELLPAVTSQTLNGFAGEMWPADFNRDGVTDLVGRQRVSPGAIQIALGNADGTFRPAVASTTNGQPMATADVNRDGFVDVVAQVGTTVMVLPGTGTASLGAPRAVLAAVATFAIVADMNRDGFRDVVMGEECCSLHVVPGNGDLTFQPAHTMDTAAFPHGATVADFNGDGLPDMAVAHRYERRFVVFRNNGGFLFTPSELPIAHSSTDVTTRDLDGDNTLDLVVSARGPSDDGPAWDVGLVYVYRGNGDGTFAAPRTFPSEGGPHSVVVGDFTHDGKVDVATFNGPRFHVDTSCGFLLSDDSVSILPGNGDGTFGAPTNFAIERGGFASQVVTLNTSDVNRDRFPDLITGHGRILLTTSPRANRPPVANAGADQRVIGDPEAVLRASASDPDGHLLTFTWTDGGAGGSFFVPQSLLTCYVAPSVPGTFTLTLTADDANGSTASDSLTVTFERFPEPPTIFVPKPENGEVLTVNVPYELAWEVSDFDGVADIDVRFTVDGRTFEPIAECTNLPGTATGCTWNSPGPLTETGQILVFATDTTGLESANSSGRFAIRPPGESGALPNGWTLTDVGDVDARGSASFDNGTFTVRGSGAGIGGTSDEFHWAYTTMTGDFDVTTRVASVQNVNEFTQAGLMIRADTSATSVHASLFATPGHGLAFQRRRSPGGTTALTAGPARTAPVWLRLSRRGTKIVASYRTAITTAWRRVGTDSISVLGSTVLVGLAVSSHVDSTVATARFDNVDVVAAPTFASVDVGPVGVAGTTGTDGVAVTVQGSGADIGGTADAFRFHRTAWTGAGTITARLRTLENTHASAKAGVMFRESLAANARHVMVVITPAGGMAMQYRAVTGGTTATAGLRAGTPPEWLRLTRDGNVFTGFASNDGVTWAPIGSVTMTMGTAVSAGLAVTSHDDTTLATGLFDDVSIRR